MNIIIGVILGFAVCALLTAKMLVRKAKEGARPVLDYDGSVYWQKNKETSE